MGEPMAELLRCWTAATAVLDAAGDYELSFIPRRDEPNLGADSRGEWVIERITSWEVVRLPHARTA